MDSHLGPLIGLVAAFVSLAFLVAYDGLRERHRADLAMVVGLLAWIVDVFWHNYMVRSSRNLVDAFVDHFNFQFCLAAGTGLVLLAVSAYHKRIAIIWPIEAVGGGLLLAIWVTTDLHSGWLLAWRGLTVTVCIIMFVALVSWVVARRDRYAWTVFALSLVLMLCGVGGVLWHDQFIPWAAVGFYIYPPALLSLWWVVSGRVGILRAPVLADQVPVRVDERERIAQEVHDGVGSHLVSILSSLDMSDPHERELAMALEECLLDLKMTVDQLQVDFHSLTVAMGMLRYRVQPSLDRSGVKLKWLVEQHPALETISKGVIVQVLRISQEAISNAMRHAQASQLSVGIRYLEGSHSIELNLADNGKGFDAAGVDRGRGLDGMQRRARQIGGLLDISSHPGRGCEIRLLLPCDDGYPQQTPRPQAPP